MAFLYLQRSTFHFPLFPVLPPWRLSQFYFAVKKRRIPAWLYKWFWLSFPQFFLGKLFLIHVLSWCPSASPSNCTLHHPDRKATKKLEETFTCRTKEGSGDWSRSRVSEHNYRSLPCRYLAPTKASKGNGNELWSQMIKRFSAYFKQPVSSYPYSLRQIHCSVSLSQYSIYHSTTRVVTILHPW